MATCHFGGADGIELPVVGRSCRGFVMADQAIVIIHGMREQRPMDFSVAFVG
jgi:hypothetical protein